MRTLLREMLTKHGFFHLLEAGTESETLEFMRGEKKKFFTIIDSELLGPLVLDELKENGRFVIFSHSQSNKTLGLAASLGVEHIVSFPLPSRELVAKIESLL